jgi:DedD protein
MEEKTELNDIILNQGGSGGGSKKILLAVASLAIILIIVVVIMNSMQSQSIQNLPQPVLPKEPKSVTTQVQNIIEEDPLFEPVEVINETTNSDNLDKIAQKLKEDSLKEETIKEVVIIEEPKVEPVVTPKPTPKPVAKKKVAPKPVQTVKKASYVDGVSKGKHYIQVGSFAQYKPNKSFLNKITSGGNSYTFHEVMINGKRLNKVLIGPFDSKAQAKKALPKIRKNIIKGAFIVKV